MDAAIRIELLKSLSEGKYGFYGDIPVDRAMALYLSHFGSGRLLLKAAKAEVGTKRLRKDGKYWIKQADGKWKPEKKGKKGKKEDKKKKKKKKPIDELKKKRRSEGWQKYKKKVEEIDPDAVPKPVAGLSSGKMAMVNEEKGILYVVSKKSGVKGTVIKRLDLEKTKEAIKKRFKSSNVEKMEQFYDRKNDAEIDTAIAEAGGEDAIKSTLITDDMVDGLKNKKKESRSFRTVETEEGNLIVEGFWKGFIVEDMVTMQSRLRGSSGYMLDEKSGRAKGRIYRTDKGRRMVRLYHEAYARKDGGYARIYVPKGDKELIKRLMEINGMKRLAPTGHVFKFPLNRMMEVVEAMPSLAMDENIVKKVQENMAKRSSAMMLKYAQMGKERAKDAQKSLDTLELAEYDGWRGYDIPGMAKKVGGEDFRLRYVQVQSLKKMVNDPKGSILGLDTGLGKTLTAIAYHMKMRELGKYNKNSNGKAAIVTLNSNLPTYMSEIDTFTEGGGEWKKNKDGSVENEHFVLYPASRFEKNFGSTKKTGETLDEEKTKQLQGFGSIILDEPQEYMKGKGTRIYNTLVNLDHDRKIISSESVMTKNPKEIENYVHIKDNINDPEARDDAHRAFNSMFERDSSRAAATPKEEYEDNVRRYIRDNVIYFHKTDEPTMIFHSPDTPDMKFRTPFGRGEENADRSHAKVRAEDDKHHELIMGKYKELSSGIRGTMNDLLNTFRKLDTKSGDIRELEEQVNNSTGGEVGQVFNKLREFSILPENHIPELKGKNPKIEHAFKDMKKHAQNGRRGIVFSSKPEVTLKSAQRFSKGLKGKLTISFTAQSSSKGGGGNSVDPNSAEVMKENGNITIWKDGKPLKSYKAKKMISDNGMTMKDVVNKFYEDHPEHEGKIASIHATDAYNAGHNLADQAEAIMHLDRDNYNTKKLYQRESRVIRPSRPTEETRKAAKELGYKENTPLSAVTRGHVHYYDMDVPDEMGGSMDEIEKLKGKHEEELFNRIVFGSEKVKLEEPNIESKRTTDVTKEKIESAEHKNTLYAEYNDNKKTQQVKVQQSADSQHTNSAVKRAAQPS